MKRFEYKTIEVKTIGAFTKKLNLIEVDKTINTLGQQGWELVNTNSKTVNGTIYGVYYTFKREV